MDKHIIKVIDKTLNVKAEPDPEVAETKPRRKFTVQYKLEILAKADRCTQPGQIGALLREGGLSSSNLTSWRRQRDNGVLNVLSPQKRGRKNIEKNPLSQQVASLQGENEHLKKKLRLVETIIDVQKKISKILGIPLDHNQGSKL